MKVNKSKMALCLLMASAATSSIMAHAESFSLPSNKSVDLTFETTTLPTSITTSTPKVPKAGVVTADATPLFTVTNTSLGANMQLGIAYTPNLPNQVVTVGGDGSAALAALHGQYDPANVMNITMSKPTAGSWKTVDGVHYWVTTSAVAKSSTDIITKNSQTLKADVYTASFDGVQYTP